MKRIHMILVLLVAVLMVSTTPLVPSAYADDGGSILVPGFLARAGDLEVTTNAVPPDGDDSEGDPDSMGDGLSKDFSDTGAAANSTGGPQGSAGSMSVEEYLLYILSQIQLLVL